MSKDTPEVGDVWQANLSGIIYIITAVDVRDKHRFYSMAQDGRTKIVLLDNDTIVDNTYLGKSKASINDLFKTENEK